MILNDIKISPERDDLYLHGANDASELKRICAQKMKVRPNDIISMRIKKRSVDARKKNDIHIIYSVECLTEGMTPQEETEFEYLRINKKPSVRPVIIGSGPAGMMAGLYLAKAGACPVIIERGGSVERRTAAVENFFSGGRLDTESNVQFGEGGAGTFSDGKLTTGTKDGRISEVKRLFVRFGAPEDIIYSAKPHIGTDILKNVVKNIREEIISLGGEYRFDTRLADIIVKNGALNAIILECGGVSEQMECRDMIVACGHSARDTFEMFKQRGLEMEQKPFSIGVRIEHTQSMLNAIQYGRYAENERAMRALGAADYKLAVRTRSGRGVYTFCMCPGGSVVAAASETASVCTNGMSLRARNNVNGNSAVLVGIEPKDFGSSDCLAGMYLQRQIERSAYVAVNGEYAPDKAVKAPAQLVGDLLAERPSREGGSVKPSYLPGVEWTDIGRCLPNYITDALREGIMLFDRKMNGFATHDAVLTAPETRSSSPIRMVRGEGLESNIGGIFPCGEGAGYAGGIMSAAVDGLRCAGALAEKMNI